VNREIKKYLKGRHDLEDLGIDGRLILKRILGKQMGGCRLDLSDSG
jgi:hypothetical protein